MLLTINTLLTLNFITLITFIIMSSCYIFVYIRFFVINFYYICANKKCYFRFKWRIMWLLFSPRHIWRIRIWMFEKMYKNQHSHLREGLMLKVSYSIVIYYIFYKYIASILIIVFILLLIYFLFFSCNTLVAKKSTRGSTLQRASRPSFATLTHFATLSRSTATKFKQSWKITICTWQWKSSCAQRWATII